MIGDGRETYSDSTLISIKKSRLIKIIRCLENNLRSANETIDIQTKQCEKLIKSTESAYYQQGRADAEKELQGLKYLGKLYSEIRAEAIDEYKHRLKETFNNEFPTNYHSTHPYFTLDNVRVLADAVAKEMKEQTNEKDS